MIELSKIRRLAILRDVYGTIIIPDEVYSDVVIHGGGMPGAAEVDAAPWIETRTVGDKDGVRELHAMLTQDQRMKADVQFGSACSGIPKLTEQIKVKEGPVS